MKIGIDAQSTQGKKSGLGIYTDSLCEYLSAEASDDFSFSYFTHPEKENLNTIDRLVWENVLLPCQIKKEQIDLLHIPAFAPPLLKPKKMVVTVHDLIGMLFPNQRGLPSAFYWGKWLPWRVKSADKVIVDSLYTKKDLMKHLKVNEKKIEVVYLSGHEAFISDISESSQGQVREKFNISERYFLFVGTLEPRKNLKNVVKAFSHFLKLKKREEGFQLVVVGSKDFAHGQYFQELVDQSGVNKGDVVFTGYVNHDELNALYAGAVAFLFPSLYEGFGIPILEAMGAGVPVIASELSSVPEVAGDAGYYVDAYDPQSIASAMLELASQENLRQDLIQKGYSQKERFSWQKMAQETLRVYKSLI